MLNVSQFYATFIHFAAESNKMFTLLRIDRTGGNWGDGISTIIHIYIISHSLRFIRLVATVLIVRIVNGWGGGGGKKLS